MTARPKIHCGIFIRCVFTVSMVLFLVYPAFASKNKLLSTINLFRLENGRMPLRLNTDLNEAAKKHALSMLQDDFFDHVSPSGSTLRSRVELTGYKWRLLGENLAAGMSLPHEVLQSWINSKSHRKTLLTREFIHAGIFHLHSKHDDGEVVFKDYWVLKLATPEKEN